MKYNRKKVFKNSNINIKKKFIINKKIKKAVKKAKITARRIYEQLTLNSIQKIKTNRILKIKVRKQI